MQMLLLFLFVVLGSCTLPWYMPSLEVSAATQEQTEETGWAEGYTCKQAAVSTNTSQELHHQCSTTMDCDTGLSCFHATTNSKGCCLMALKPNETGCVVDEQCKRACESTICDRSQLPSRCLCEKGRHFLFNKCWKKCPEFAHETPTIDDRGFSQCTLKTDLRTAVNYMRRMRRQLRSNFC